MAFALAFAVAFALAFATAATDEAGPDPTNAEGADDDEGPDDKILEEALVIFTQAQAQESPEGLNL